MRSSKSRSRSKSNRQRSIGNVINRVFESSGPEGKVRGTPQQIIEKYLVLARDAQLSNDRVAEQNFLQHAEHYTRLLHEAQREMAARQQGANGGNGNGNGNGNNGGNGTPYNRDGQNERSGERSYGERSGERAEELNEPTLTPSEANETGLVDTPESHAEEAPSRPEPVEASADAQPAAPSDKPKRARKPRAPKAEGDDAPKPRSRSRRKPKAESDQSPANEQTPAPGADADASSEG